MIPSVLSGMFFFVFFSYNYTSMALIRFSKFKGVLKFIKRGKA